MSKEKLKKVSQKEKELEEMKEKYTQLKKKYQQLEKDFELLQTKLSQQEKEASEYLDLLKRLKADFDNYRRRVIKEQTFLVERASRELIEKLLPILDNLERALKAARNNSDYQSFLSGVEMIYQQLMEVLKSEGLEAINPETQPFDPECHEAVISEVRTDYQDETILEVLEKGYRLKGALLRPAKVKVCRLPEKDKGDDVR